MTELIVGVFIGLLVTVVVGWGIIIAVSFGRHL